MVALGTRFAWLDWTRRRVQCARLLPCPTEGRWARNSNGTPLNAWIRKQVVATRWREPTAHADSTTEIAVAQLAPVLPDSAGGVTRLEQA